MLKLPILARVFNLPIHLNKCLDVWSGFLIGLTLLPTLRKRSPHPRRSCCGESNMPSRCCSGFSCPRFKHTRLIWDGAHQILIMGSGYPSGTTDSECLAPWHNRFGGHHQAPMNYEWWALTGAESLQEICLFFSFQSVEGVTNLCR
jgi:hypothetical protein